LFGQFLEQDGHHRFPGAGGAGHPDDNAGLPGSVANVHGFPKQIQIKSLLPRGKAGEVNGLLGDHQRGWENQFRTLHARSLTAKHTKHTKAFLTTACRAEAGEGGMNTDGHGFVLSASNGDLSCLGSNERNSP
jgi:hypothetical protein